MINRKKIVGTMTTVKMNGETTTREIEVGDVAQEVHSALGDYLEMVPYFSQYMGKPCVAFVGENGKRKGLALNPLATTMWRLEFPFPHNQDYISGPLVIIQGPEAFMREL